MDLDHLDVALGEVVVEGQTRWPVRFRCFAWLCGRGCRVDPRRQQAMSGQAAGVYCYFKVAEVASLIACSRRALLAATTRRWWLRWVG